MPQIQTLRNRFYNQWSAAHDNSIGWKSVDVQVDGRQSVFDVSNPFRWPDDTPTCDEIQDYRDDITQPNSVLTPRRRHLGFAHGRYWHDSFVDTEEDDNVFTEIHVIVVQISAQMPRLVLVSMTAMVHAIPTGLEGGLRYVPGQPVDVSALPMVFRAAAGLTLQYCLEKEYPAERDFAYRCYVKARSTSTVREVWNAVANVEGWETSCEGIFAWHFPNIAPDETVSQYFDAMMPPQDTLAQSAANLDWQRDGRRTLHLSWAGSNFRHMHSDLHPHYAGHERR